MEIMIYSEKESASQRSLVKETCSESVTYSFARFSLRPEKEREPSRPYIFTWCPSESKYHDKKEPQRPQPITVIFKIKTSALKAQYISLLFNVNIIYEEN